MRLLVVFTILNALSAISNFFVGNYGVGAFNIFALVLLVLILLIGRKELT